jgi:hypothetical protein
MQIQNRQDYGERVSDSPLAQRAVTCDQIDGHRVWRLPGTQSQAPRALPPSRSDRFIEVPPEEEGVRRKGYIMALHEGRCSICDKRIKAAIGEDEGDLIYWCKKTRNSAGFRAHKRCYQDAMGFTD